MGVAEVHWLPVLEEEKRQLKQLSPTSAWTKGLMQRHRLPRAIRVDNGTEFTSKRLDQWAYLNRVELDFSRTGKTTDNAFVEALNGRFRQECLNENWLLPLEDATEKAESWRRHYNGERPHSALGNLSPPVSLPHWLNRLVAGHR